MNDLMNFSYYKELFCNRPNILNSFTDKSIHDVLLYQIIKTFVSVLKQTTETGSEALIYQALLLKRNG